MSEKRYLLLKGSEDGNPVRWLSALALQDLLDDPQEDSGITEFRDPDTLDRDHNYWPAGVGVLLRVEVIIPVPAGAYRLPEDYEPPLADNLPCDTLPTPMSEWVASSDGKPLRLSGVHDA